MIGAEVTVYVSRREAVDGVTYVAFMECTVEKVQFVGLFTGPTIKVHTSHHLLTEPIINEKRLYLPCA